MKAITKTSRINAAILVIQRMNEGMTVVDACDDVGIPRSSYYEIIKNNPEVIAEYQEMVEVNAKEQLGMILLHKNQILQKIIEDGLSDQTTPKDRLAIFKGLNELVDNLGQNLQIENRAAVEAHKFLKQGPVISPQVSRLSATQTTILIEG